MPKLIIGSAPHLWIWVPDLGTDQIRLAGYCVITDIDPTECVDVYDKLGAKRKAIHTKNGLYLITAAKFTNWGKYPHFRDLEEVEHDEI
jgi:hypothetical protein